MYGVIDIGSNTIRLVIYKIEGNILVPMLNKKCPVGLAGYINKSKVMSKEGILKATEALKEFEEILLFMNIEEVFTFATASLRNIANSNEAIRYINANTAFTITLLSGDEEAMFDYYGAMQNLKLTQGMVVDIGGGSTELVRYNGKEIISTNSLPIGSLNLYNGHIQSILPNKKEIIEIQKATKKHLEAVNGKHLATPRLCGVGGTARAIHKMLYSMNKVDNNRYSTADLADLIDMAIEDREKFAKLILKTTPDRIHTFIPGLIALNTIAKYYNAKEVVTSSYGVREGYLHYLLEKRGIIDEI